jgi:hypothetical protein
MINKPMIYNSIKLILLISGRHILKEATFGRQYAFLKELRKREGEIARLIYQLKLIVVIGPPLK